VAVVERTAALRESQAALAAAERLAALGQFSAGLAREVSGPAAEASASLDALARELGGDGGEQVRGSVQRARAALGRITALVHQLLVAGRAGGAVPQPPIEVRVGPAVEAALAAVRARGVGQVALEVTVSRGLTVLGDEEALVQVFSTLVGNAVQGIGLGRPGTVRVQASAEGRRARIVVEDDGAGMSGDELLHVFEPFYGAGEAGGGRGLGLAVARGLAEAMGGALRFESTPGRGTKAILELHRGAPHVSAADLPAPTLAAPRRARVLVVDDHPDALRELVKVVCAEHEVYAARGVGEALTELGTRSFDLVLCEATLSRHGAERFWQELLLRAPEVQGRVVFTTGRDAAHAAREFLARQPQPVLERPFGLEDVHEAMRRLGIAPALTPPPAAPAPTPEQPLGRVRRT
jgi:CheY-like chemotaxis protein